MRHWASTGAGVLDGHGCLVVSEGIHALVEGCAGDSWVILCQSARLNSITPALQVSE